MTILPAIALALVLGFAAHRASVCTVRAVAEVMSSRGGAIFASLARSVLWVWAVTLPALWLTAGAVPSGWSLSTAAVLGGFVFGFGAAINGGCAYSTMARFVDGDGRMLAAIAGFSLGVVLFAALAGHPWLPRPVQAPALIGVLAPWLAAPAVMTLAWAVYETVRLWRTRPAGRRLRDLVLAPRYRLSTAALLMGLPGAVLFLMFGAFGYTATFELMVEGVVGTRPWPSATRTVLLVAVLAGMALSTVQRGTFRFDWRPQVAWLQHVAGGALMGFGTALAPGGNDALVLYGIPTLSPYAAPAFAAMVVGIVAGLLALRALFGVVATVECRNDVFVSDTWSRPITDRPK